jgi:hypothetical protein
MIAARSLVGSGARYLLVSATIVLSIAPSAARAELAAPHDAAASGVPATRDLSLQAGFSIYRMSSGSSATVAGPKLTIEYGRPTGAVGYGHFELNYQDVERKLVSLDFGAVLEARL